MVPRVCSRPEPSSHLDYLLMHNVQVTRLEIGGNVVVVRDIMEEDMESKNLVEYHN